MAYDRYDPRRGPREQSRFSDDRNRDRDPGDRGREERGFFERAGDEIASWFGDDEGERGRRRDEQMGGRDDDNGRDDDSRRRFSSGRDRARVEGDNDRDRTRRSSPGDRDYRSSSDREPWGGGDRNDRGDDRGGYRPMAGDYGRSQGPFAAGGSGRGDSEGRGRYDRGEGNWDRDDARRARIVGSSDRSQPQDPHYQQWRQRQIDELDRDYDEYRREHQSKFENDFGSWRSNRQTKRQMLGMIREHMEVVGSDDEHVGKVDRVAGDSIILAKSDPEAGGAHHSLSCSEIGRVEGDRVILDVTAEQGRNRWRDESRERALFEREDQGEAGPHALDRSFSGTYR